MSNAFPAPSTGVLLLRKPMCSCVRVASGSVMSNCLAPYIRPLIFGFSNKVSGTGGRMFNAW